MYKWFIPGCIRQVERTPKGKHGKCQRCIFIQSPSTAFDFAFYSRSKQTVTAETREGATYSESVTLADYEDIEEIPPPNTFQNSSQCQWKMTKRQQKYTSTWRLRDPV